MTGCFPSEPLQCKCLCHLQYNYIGGCLNCNCKPVYGFDGKIKYTEINRENVCPMCSGKGVVINSS
jgi:hypothetical protein